MPSFMYCPRCRGRFTRRSPKLFICVKCHFHYFLNPAPANGVIFENPKSELLLVERAVAPKKGYWDVPGGFVDPGETIEESVVREVKEELGIAVNRFHYLCSVPDRYVYRGVTYPTIVFFFTARITTAEISALRPADDVASCRFFLPRRIPFKRIAFAGVKKMLRECTKKKRNIRR